MGFWKLMMPVAALACTLGGCNDFLAERMVAPPNGGHAFAPKIATSLAIGDAIHIPVGPPDATIAAWILEPKVPARGTILVLHGFVNDHHSVQNADKALCDAGYRAVNLDLRGHGQSTGQYLTFGVNDAADLAAITTYLQDRKLCGETDGVYGTSYGAASAILFAGSDPRVKAVVAVAPFASLREEAPYFGKHLLPIPGAFMSDQDYVSVVNKMGVVAGFNPDNSSPLDAIKKTQAHVRLFHGDADMIVATQSSRELAAADPDRTQLTILPGKGHLELCFDIFGVLRADTRTWFDTYLATTPPKTLARN